MTIIQQKHRLEQEQQIILPLGLGFGEVDGLRKETAREQPIEEFHVLGTQLSLRFLDCRKGNPAVDVEKQ